VGWGCGFGIGGWGGGKGLGSGESGSGSGLLSYCHLNAMIIWFSISTFSLREAWDLPVLAKITAKVCNCCGG